METCASDSSQLVVLVPALGRIVVVAPALHTTKTVSDCKARKGNRSVASNYGVHLARGAILYVIFARHIELNIAPRLYCEVAPYALRVGVGCKKEKR
jgi:hypothetical protein